MARRLIAAGWVDAPASSGRAGVRARFTAPRATGQGLRAGRAPMAGACAARTGCPGCSPREIHLRLSAASPVRHAADAEGILGDRRGLHGEGEALQPTGPHRARCRGRDASRGRPCPVSAPTGSGLPLTGKDRGLAVLQALTSRLPAGCRVAVASDLVAGAFAADRPVWSKAAEPSLAWTGPHAPRAARRAALLRG